MGHWWLLQIKAFQLEPIQLPQRVAQRRQLKRRMALHAALEVRAHASRRESCDQSCNALVIHWLALKTNA